MNEIALDRHEREQQAWLNSLPKCDYCGEPIQDEQYYDFGNEIGCQKCVKDKWLVSNRAV